MTASDPAPEEGATGTSGLEPDPIPEPGVAAPRVTRASAAWAATGSALVLLALLIVFVLQNQKHVQIRFFGFDTTVPLGMAMLIAAVVGGVLVAISGLARIMQLRRYVRRNRQRLTPS